MCTDGEQLHNTSDQIVGIWLDSFQVACRSSLILLWLTVFTTRLVRNETLTLAFDLKLGDYLKIDWQSIPAISRVYKTAPANTSTNIETVLGHTWVHMHFFWCGNTNRFLIDINRPIRVICGSFYSVDIWGFFLVVILQLFFQISNNPSYVGISAHRRTVIWLKDCQQRLQYFWVLHYTFSRRTVVISCCFSRPAKLLNHTITLFSLISVLSLYLSTANSTRVYSTSCPLNYLLDQEREKLSSPIVFWSWTYSHLCVSFYLTFTK